MWIPLILVPIPSCKINYLVLNRCSNLRSGNKLMKKLLSKIIKRLKGFLIMSTTSFLKLSKQEINVKLRSQKTKQAKSNY